MTTTAKLASDSKLAWIDEATADSMFHRLGSHHLAIVEFKVATRTEKDADDEDQVVVLKVTNVSLADQPKLEDHLRELQRAEYMRRKNGDQLPLGDASEDSDEIIRRGRNVLLLCQVCLHKAADDTITHAVDPDADGAQCTWAETGDPVTPGDGDDDLVEAEIVVDPDEDGDIPGDDGPWPGDDDYNVVALAPTSGVTNPFPAS